ncbi:MAG TPA: NAD(P)-dependent oxidoreductase, partial [Bacillota bacterium]|nr:NAD(P)-dependent oxidoreductase [Bacillota bacterium]
VADNSDCAGRGFVAALDVMARGLEGKQVLVIGAGPVGKGAAMALAGFGAEITVHDVNPTASAALVDCIWQQTGCRARIEPSLTKALEQHSFIIDASPGEGLIQPEYIKPDTLIAAPGVPLGISGECSQLLSGKVLHNPLQLGVATMLYDALRGTAYGD